MNLKEIILSEKMPISKGQILHDPIYINILYMRKLEIENRLVVARS